MRGSRKKFIPNGDEDFASMANHFARTIAADPARFAVAPDDAAALSAAVERYRAALLAARSERTRATTHAKDEARADAERIVRRLGHGLRVAEGVTDVSRILLGLRPRTTKPSKAQTCPQEPPRLRFLRALHEAAGASAVHELEFRSIDYAAARPAGAVRLELFVDLIAPEEPVPTHPWARYGGQGGQGGWYLRSYTRSPIVLAPPMAIVPMLVVYWGRWADSAGNVGPFSATVISRIEGGPLHLVRGFQSGAARPVPLPAADHGVDDPASRFRVARLDARERSLEPREADAPPPPPLALPSPTTRELPRLEGASSQRATAAEDAAAA